MLPTESGSVLLPLARAAIAADLGRPAQPGIHAQWLDAPGASFVTLTSDGRLRGCIGSLLAYRSLREDVADNARAAAFRDRRFPPLVASEFDQIRLEVSVLTEPEPLSFTDVHDALAQLRPGIDGVVLRRGTQRATFLPQVWEQLPQPSVFLKSLLIKAGLTGWDSQITLERYQVQAWTEPQGDPAAAAQPGA